MKAGDTGEAESLGLQTGRLSVHEMHLGNAALSVIGVLEVHLPNGPPLPSCT